MPEYPFYAYHGNRSALTETQAWKDVRFAIANCPFSLYYLLEDVAYDYPGDMLKIAPIGTKPHALGAILFALNGSGVWKWSTIVLSEKRKGLKEH